MSALVLHAQAAAAVFRRDLAIFTSYRMRLVTTIVATLVTLTVFYYVSRLVRSDKIGAPDDYYAFAVIGILALSVLSAALSRPVATLRAEQLAGTFERMVVSPFGAVRCVISLLLFPLALAFVTSAVSLAFAVVVFGVKLRWPEALAAMPVALLGALAFAPLGLLMTAAVIVFKQTNAGATFVLTACTLLAAVN